MPARKAVNRPLPATVNSSQCSEEYLVSLATRMLKLFLSANLAQQEIVNGGSRKSAWPRTIAEATRASSALPKRPSDRADDVEYGAADFAADCASAAERKVARARAATARIRVISTSYPIKVFSEWVIQAAVRPARVAT